MNDAMNQLGESNRRALKRRDAYRAGDKGVEGGFQKLKHAFPYYGFVECSSEGIPFLMFHANDDVVAWEYFWQGDDTYEQKIVRQWVSWAREASAVLDIGAYTGLMSILAAKANPKAKVHALEPIERTVERLKINLRANGVADRVTAHAKAASSDYGVDMINYYRDEDFLGTGNSLQAKEGKKVFARRMIQTVNLDHYLGSKEKFDLVKIDVEGFEHVVLEGAQRIIRRDRPRLVIEIWQENRSSVLGLLQELGYNCSAVEPKEVRVMNYLCEPQPRSN